MYTEGVPNFGLVAVLGPVGVRLHSQNLSQDLQIPDAKFCQVSVVPF